MNAFGNGSSISDAIESDFHGSNLAEEHLAIKIQEYFTHTVWRQLLFPVNDNYNSR
jgi:hypothetical protein